MKVGENDKKKKRGVVNERVREDDNGTRTNDSIVCYCYFNSQLTRSLPMFYFILLNYEAQ